jgi:hypothetical protein
MKSDHKLAKYLFVIILLPIALAFCSGDRFRYPCQNPENWDKDFCKMPLCDVTRTCPEHIFKGQNDPRLGPNATPTQTAPQISNPQPSPGVVCK